MAFNIVLRLREAINAYENRGIARVDAGDHYVTIEGFSEIIARKPKKSLIVFTERLNGSLGREK